MKILYIIDEMEALTAGGTERQVLHMARVCRQAGFVPQILVLRGTEWLNCQACGCAVRHGKLERILSVAGVVEMFRLVRWMRAERFQIVQAFFAESNLIAPILAWLADVPVRIGSRRNEGSWMSPWFVRMQRVSNWFATRLLANSEGVRLSVSNLERTLPAKIDVLYNGVDTARFCPDSQSRARVRGELGIDPVEVVVGSSSNFVAVKRLDLLLQAAELVARKYPKTKFVLVGDGPERTRLEQLRDKLALGNWVQFAGRVDDVPGFLSACDVFVLSSSHEGFSNGLLEAMATGLACVATDAGGNREALGDCGVLVPPRNATILADEIMALVCDPGRRVAIGDSARRRVIARFSAAGSDRQLADYYLALLRETGASVAQESQQCGESSAQSR